MSLAGREYEIIVLKKQLKRTQSSFVAMYGRRRIGKTYLIRQVYAKQMVFDCSGLHEKSTSQQLENFHLALNDFYKKNAKKETPTSWLKAFAVLKEYINSLKGTSKKVVFFDEISWFDVPKSGFKAALDNFWNQYASKRTDIILIICGSAASWIIKNIVNDRGGFHNRITCSIALQPFTLKETQAFLKLKKVELVLKDVVQLYMATGGVPFYLDNVEQGNSVQQIIQNLYFSSMATLKGEFNNLYAALFKNCEDHIAVIKALATKSKGLTRSEIIKITKLTTGGGLTNTIKELMYCGFITQIYPINKIKEDVLYRLMDEYSIFYLKFIEGKAGKMDWAKMDNAPAYKIWCGYAFENICLRHTENIKNALGIGGVLTTEYGWQVKGTASNRGAQIDLVIDRKDNCINICEAKFYAAEYEMTKLYADQLQHKKTQFISNTKTKKNIFITLITASGAVINKYYNSIITNSISIDDLFK